MESKRNFYSVVREAPASSPIGAVAIADLRRSAVTESVVKDLPQGPTSVTQMKKVVPLGKNETTGAPIQSNIEQASAKNPELAVKRNLENALRLIDCASRWPPGVKDLVSFPEFFLTGYSEYTSGPLQWSREDYLRVAREIPGEETDRLGEKAKQYNLYIAGTVHTKEAEWPNHYFHTQFIIGPNGKVIHKHWKAHINPNATEWATTVHDVLDEFVKRYWWDAVWPVAVTDIGNLATLTGSEGHSPESWRAYAFKGAEIYDWMMSSGWTQGHSQFILQAMCSVNRCYGFLNQPARILNNVNHSESCYHNATLIADYSGRILQERREPSEGSLSEPLHIQDLLTRKQKMGLQIPSLRSTLYSHIYSEKYEKYPANQYSEYLPKDHTDAFRYAQSKARWS